MADNGSGSMSAIVAVVAIIVIAFVAYVGIMMFRNNPNPDAGGTAGINVNLGTDGGGNTGM